MKRQARHLLGALVGVVALGSVSTAQANYPERPVRIVVPFAPGGSVDVFARIATDKLSKRTGKQFYIENVAGASGNIAAGQVAKAAPDGYTVLFAFSSFVVNPSLFASVPYDALKSFEPVTLAVTATHVVTVTPSVAAKSVAELVALIKATPGKFSFAHGGAGTPAHLLGEQFRLKTGLDIAPVPFNGAGPAVQSVIGGHTPIGITAISPAAPQIAAGQIRALAVTSKARTRFLPDVPTMVEQGHPDIVGDLWVGVLVPKGTSKDIVTFLHRELSAVLAQKDTQDRLSAVGFEAVGSAPEAFGKQMAAELESWRAVIQAAKIKSP
ncbi:MAG: tripartite tricarboxylate transporter substrate binding protein [Hyphomicrobiaceae bacterium]